MSQGQCHRGGWAAMATPLSGPFQKKWQYLQAYSYMYVPRTVWFMSTLLWSALC